MKSRDLWLMYGWSQESNQGVGMHNHGLLISTRTAYSFLQLPFSGGVLHITVGSKIEERILTERKAEQVVWLELVTGSKQQNKEKSVVNREFDFLDFNILKKPQNITNHVKRLSHRNTELFGLDWTLEIIQF